VGASHHGGSDMGLVHSGMHETLLTYKLNLGMNLLVRNLELCGATTFDYINAHLINAQLTICAQTVECSFCRNTYASVTDLDAQLQSAQRISGIRVTWC
jgi:hypothetical protein